MGLRVRKKKNKSGSISIHIVDRSNRGYKLVESFGSSKDLEAVDNLYQKALERIDELEKNLFYISKEKSKKEKIKELLSEITTQNFIPIGDELVFGKIFNDIGCNDIFDEIKNIRKKEEKKFLFKSLVISRLLYPGSKLELIHYLDYFKNIKIDENKIYRFLDTIYKEEIKLQIERCIFNNTISILPNKELVVSFYDVTTLHFESESEDDLRRIGFSKEGKLNRPQIQIGLLTTIEGYPLGYEIYEGNKFEGNTLIESLKLLEKKFKLNHKPIVVADRGMFNNCNLIELDNNGYKYIIGAKIKTLSQDIKNQIISLDLKVDNQTKEIKLNEELICKVKNKENEENKIKTTKKYTITKKTISQRLIISYSLQRAKKDKYLRDKALEKLETKLNQKNLKKSDLKLSYYAKYLDLEDKNNCPIQFKLNNTKVKLDEKLDGLKGYITNDITLSHNEIISHYTNLYNIEKAFRISKTDLRIRPIYHRLETRIKSHILIAFTSYAVYKEFERKLKINNVKFDFSQKLLRKIIEHIIALKIDDEIIPINPSDIQNQILNAIKN